MTTLNRARVTYTVDIRVLIAYRLPLYRRRKSTETVMEFERTQSARHTGLFRQVTGFCRGGAEGRGVLMISNSRVRRTVWGRKTCAGRIWNREEQRGLITATERTDRGRRTAQRVHLRAVFFFSSAAFFQTANAVKMAATARRVDGGGTRAVARAHRVHFGRRGRHRNTCRVPPPSRDREPPDGKTGATVQTRPIRSTLKRRVADPRVRVATRFRSSHRTFRRRSIGGKTHPSFRVSARKTIRRRARAQVYRVRCSRVYGSGSEKDRASEMRRSSVALPRACGCRWISRAKSCARVLRGCACARDEKVSLVVRTRRRVQRMRRRRRR